MLSTIMTRTQKNPWQAVLMGGPPGSRLTPDMPLGGLQMQEMTYSVSQGATPASRREKEPEGWRIGVVGEGLPGKCVYHGKPQTLGCQHRRT
ncbi:uncharacterized [Tachysurus ichikawai]